MKIQSMQYAILIICFSLLYSPVEGQNDPNCKLPLNFQVPLSGELYMADPYLSGLPFYPTSDLQKGRVILNNGKEVGGLLLKYNGFIDQLIWFNEKTGKQVQLDKEQIEGFFLKGQEQGINYNFTKIKLLKLPLRNNNLSPFFAEVLQEGKVSLYAYRNFITTGKETRSYRGTQRIVDIIKLSTEYFFIFPGNKGFSKTKITGEQFYDQLYDFNSRIARKLGRDIAIQNEEDLNRVAKALSELFDDL